MGLTSGKSWRHVTPTGAVQQLTVKSRCSMRRTNVSRIFLIVTVITVGWALVAYAFPPIPHQFSGIVRVDGNNVPNGTVISAWMDSIQLATTQAWITPPDGGSSWYSISVPGDDPDTPPIEGAYPGAIIRFCIGSPCSDWADQQGTWQSGGITTLNLTVGDPALSIGTQIFADEHRSRKRIYVDQR